MCNGGKYFQRMSFSALRFYFRKNIESKFGRHDTELNFGHYPGQMIHMKECLFIETSLQPMYDSGIIFFTSFFCFLKMMLLH